MAEIETQRSPLRDRMLLATGLGFVAVLAGGQLALLRAGSSLSDPSGTLASRFETIDTWGQVLGLPLGLASAVLIGIGLFDEGIGSRRGALRMLVLGAFFAMVFVSFGVLDPLTQSLLAAQGELYEFEARLDELRRWTWVVGALLLVVGVSLVAAHRAPVPARPDRADALGPADRRLLMLVGTATFFHGYDSSIAALALPYIGADLGADASALAFGLAIIRLGSFGAVLGGRLADRTGRRRILLGSVLAYTAAVVATAFSQGLVDFVIYQLIATIFLATELVIAQVLVAEGFRASIRGHGQGLLGAFNALGWGLAALLFPVFQGSALGWRGLYLVGVGPLLLVAFLRRGLEESERWTRRVASGGARMGLRALRAHGLAGKLAIFTVLEFGTDAARGASTAFGSHHLTTEMGWPPASVSLLILGAGSASFVAQFFAGRLADRFGRRLVAASSIVLGGVAIVVFYSTPYVAPGYALITLTGTLLSVSIIALSTESFPTEARSTVRGWLVTSGTLGGMVGLSAIGVLSDALGGAGTVIAGLGVASLALAPLVFAVPETARAELVESEDGI